MDIRLDFSNSFRGRKEELQVLIQAYHDACEEGNERVCVNISGASGTGKSSLVEAFHEKLGDKALFGSGKLDQGRASSEPFEAVALSLAEILAQLELSPEKESWKKKIQTSLEGELQVLQSVLPMGFFGLNNETDTASKRVSSSPNKEYGFDRLRFAFRSLVRTLSAAQPVVLFIDDLQWAERETLSLIEVLLSDNAPRKILFIGANRPESNADSAISMMETYSVRKINLDKLSLKEINDVLVGLVKREEDEVQELASVVARKTGGNAFAMTQFLLLLEKHGILHYSMQTYQWEWDIDRVVSETELSDNVVEQVAITVIECVAAETLKVAECLGLTRFPVELLDEVISGIRPGQHKDDVDLEYLLDVAVKDGLLEKLASGDYKFSHDRIREACHTLLPTGQERLELHLSIGRVLRDSLAHHTEIDYSDPKENRKLFLAVNHLNAAVTCIDDANERRELALTNLAAAKLAMKRATFFPAVDFVETSIQLLGDDPWGTDLDLMLELSSALARCLYSCGRLKESIEAANTVLAHARLFREKNECCHVKILSLVQLGKRKQAIEMSISVLRELGFGIPRRFHKIHVLRYYMRIKKKLARKSDEELLSLPTPDSENFHLGMEYLMRAGEVAILWGMEDLLGLLFLIGVEETIDKGRSDMTSMCFMAWASILADQGDFEGAIRYGRLGLSVATEMKGSVLDHRGIGLYYTWIWHWREPYHDALKPFTKALKAMWDGGALEGVFMDGSNSIRLHFCCGLKMQPLLDDTRQFVELLTDYQQHIVLSLNESFAQMVSNLAGESDDSTVLTGEFMVQEKSLQNWKRSQNNPAREMLYLHRLILSIYFEDDVLAGKMSAKIRNMYLEGTETYVPIRFLFKGLGALVMARQCGKRKCLKRGQAIIKVFQTWVKKGMVNAHHMLLLLKAIELSATKGGDDAVRKGFDEAIAAAGRLGFLHHQALANHRAALHFLQRNDLKLASTYLIRALELYNDWGAYGVVRHLETTHSKILVDSTSSLEITKVLSTTLLGRSRMGGFSMGEMKAKGLG